MLRNGKVEAASRRLPTRRNAASTIGYFDPGEPIANLCGNLPHWRQDGCTYFVTFRLADSVPTDKLDQWCSERDAWLRTHRGPYDLALRQEYYERFTQRFQKWLDAASGSCVLALPAVKQLVESALRHFDSIRYDLDEYVVAPNHVHVIVTPVPDHQLSDILHSWKSYTAHEILKIDAACPRLTVDAASRRVQKRRDAAATVWQKESFDHIVRNADSLDRIRAYIRAHDDVPR